MKLNDRLTSQMDVSFDSLPVAANPGRQPVQLYATEIGGHTSHRCTDDHG